MTKIMFIGLAIATIFLSSCGTNHENSSQSSEPPPVSSTSESQTQSSSAQASANVDESESSQTLSIHGVVLQDGDDKFSFLGDITAATKEDSLTKSYMIADMGNVVSEIQISLMDVNEQRDLTPDEITSIISVLQNSEIGVYDTLGNPPTGGNYFNLIAYDTSNKVYLHLAFNGEWVLFAMPDGKTLVFNGENSGLEKISDLLVSK